MKQMLIVIFLLVTLFMYAATINVPGDHSTIQAGIIAAANGDTVLVQPGTYEENINFTGKLITVASEFLNTQDPTYISTTIIDGTSSGSVVTFNNGESSSSILCGFTITNGSAGSGGGIYCNGSSPSLENLTISDNSANIGGGIYFNLSSSSLRNVTITSNTGGNHGGGIYCSNSNPSLENVTISDNNVTNYDGGGIWCNQSNPVLQNVSISDNSAYMYGGGIYCDSSNPSLENVTISENNAGWYGGGILCYDNSSPSLINSIMWNDFPEEISIDISSSVTVSYSDIQGVSGGTGNINSDPLFINAANGDFHLQSTSPCIDTGDPASSLDPDGTIADMGAFYYDQSAYAGTGSGTSTTGESVVIDVIPIDFGSGFIDPDVTFDPDTGPVTVDVVVDNAVQVGAAPPNPGNVALSYALTFTGSTAQTFHMILSYSGYAGTPAYIAWWDGSVWQVPDNVVFSSSEVGFDITPVSDRLGSEIKNGSRDGAFEFILGDENPLPVNLSSFYAVYIGGTPTLYWTTQTETGNAYWNVYRGTDSNFENAIHLNTNDPVPGNGTTTSPSDYIYFDTAPVIQNTTYWYWIEDVSLNGESQVHEPITLTIPFEDIPNTPDSYGLQQNFPNPFNPSTSISFVLAEDCYAELIIYNVKGEKVKKIFNEHVYADQINTVIWDGDDHTGKQVSSGVYFYKLITDKKEYQKKMLLVK